MAHVLHGARLLNPHIMLQFVCVVMVGPGWDGLLDLFYNFMHNKSRLVIMHLELRGTG